jgi:hypothetical protein
VIPKARALPGERSSSQAGSLMQIIEEINSIESYEFSGATG